MKEVLVDENSFQHDISTNSLIEEFELLNCTAIKDYAYLNQDHLNEFVIPDGVKIIRNNAFSNCIHLKKIVFPDSLEYIGPSAFSHCVNLEEIILPENLKKIDFRAFADCKRLKKVVLPYHLTSLPNECFKGCHQLQIILNNNVKKLGKSTFEDCYQLTTYPCDVVYLGENCFKNCRSLTNISFHSEIKSLPDGAFDGCTHLTDITAVDKIEIGKKCFRNCKSLTAIPEFVSHFNERAFENCTALRVVDMIDDSVPFACFRGCSNIEKILNQDNIFSLGAFAFSGCEKLEEIDVCHLTTIPAEAFSHCKKLKKVRMNMVVNRIDSRAFFDCKELLDINLPDTIEVIKKEAFMNCSSISSITIPANLKSLGDGAFSYMDSLECIDVSPYNKTFITPDHKILVNAMQQKLVLYASGNKDSSYSLKDYCVDIDIFEHSIFRSIDCIGKYAFAGAKNLEELTICACTRDIEATAFVGCDNLKKLNVESISFSTCPGFSIKDNGRYYFKNHSKILPYLPFETVVFSGDVFLIWDHALANFTHVKNIILPSDKDYSIGENAFSDCLLLEKVMIPKAVKHIAKNAFPSSTKLIFENGLELDHFVELSSNDQYHGNYQLYVLDNDTYYVEQNDHVIGVTKKYIEAFCTHSEEIKDNPVLFVDFMNDLISHHINIDLLYDGILMSEMDLGQRKILLYYLANADSTFFLKVLQHSQILDKVDGTTKYLLGENLLKIITYADMLKIYQVDHPLLYHKLLIRYCDIESFENLIKNHLSLLIKVISYSQLVHVEEDEPSFYLTKYILENHTLYKFMEIILKYGVKDRFLIDKCFISIADHPLFEEMIKVYDANIKRVLKSSSIIENVSTSQQNLSDLLILLKITGALEDDPIIRQRASTFICEKMFDEFLPNGDDNAYRIVGDDIHRVFNFPHIEEEFDLEFANFFLENYQELFKEEKEKSGFIQRVYLNFKQISKTSTSNKGSQRKLKVTIAKCQSFLLHNKFDGITDETQELAKLIGIWYDDNSTWLNAKAIYSESLNAPRNIFTKVGMDDHGNVCYDMNPEHDLRERINPNYSFEWLPKQDYHNFLLGKYCNCCAHIEGAGQGIMRASMILDNCQNLVIRNDAGQIIAKSTIYVNKEQGYAVFNNVETSFNYRSHEQLEKVYQAFLRGSKAFITTYNTNHIDLPITNITIGADRNTILQYLTDEKHPVVSIQQSLQFGTYSLAGSGYDGDWSFKQRLVLKRG